VTTFTPAVLGVGCLLRAFDLFGEAKRLKTGSLLTQRDEAGLIFVHGRFSAVLALVLFERLLSSEPGLVKCHRYLPIRLKRIYVLRTE
jgi:hypothetical protein